MMSDLFEKLAAPFTPDQVSWRVGVSNKKKRQRETGDNNAKATKGQVLAYIDARDVMDRLDAVCGPAGWQNRYTHADKKTICEIGVRAPEGEWIWKADGAGESDIEAEKGALSDSFKRAAVRWGIGRYLYHLPTPWVDLDEFERITDAEKRKLEALLGRGASQPTRQAPQAPAAPALTVADAKAAIDRYSSIAALEQWAVDNKPATNAMSDPDYQLVLQHWKAKRLALAAKVADKVAA